MSILPAHRKGELTVCKLATNSSMAFRGTSRKSATDLIPAFRSRSDHGRRGIGKVVLLVTAACSEAAGS